MKERNHQSVSLPATQTSLFPSAPPRKRAQRAPSVDDVSWQEHRQRLSLTGLERLFWIGLVVSLIVLNFRVLTFTTILAKAAYVLGSIVPVVLLFVLVAALLKIAIFILMSWRPESLGKRVIFLRRIVTRIGHVWKEEREDFSDDGWNDESSSDTTDEAHSYGRNDEQQARQKTYVDQSSYIPHSPVNDAIVPISIAERPTRASLFRRPESTPQPPAAVQPKAKAAPKTAKPTEKPQTNAIVASAAQSAPKVPPITETVQEALDDIGVPSVYRAWPLPPIDLLDTYTTGSISDEEKHTKARLIEQTLANFKVEAQVVGVNTGPAVMQFELQPAMGVKISKITTLEKDLALVLAAHSIRIEAPIPGKGVVGIEIPNSAIATVSMREVIDSEAFETSKGKLKLPLGKDVSGLPMVADMARMPHLLVAGSTGSGTSAAINAYVCGLLLRHTPDDLKLIMVAPKMDELIIYNQIPHLLSPVVTKLERVAPTLKWATREMERRYKVFAKHGCRNLDTYRQLARKRADLEPMPYILIVIDELADLMMMAPDEIETQICRLAQMARATGIHLIIATQRPSVDVITGLIKANFPSRIAFAVTSQIDSRVIIDAPGADHLLGRGDMLYMAADAAKLVRIQGTWVSEGEVERIVQFWRTAQPPDSQETGDETQETGDGRSAPAATTSSKAEAPLNGAASRIQMDPFALSGAADFLSADEQDELLPQAIALVKQHTRASASLLQRRMRIGYSKAAQLIDLLEQEGILGPAEGGRSRQVLENENTS